MAAFLGMRGDGDWVTNQRPENWRQMIMLLYPNGSAPLTAILSMLGAESTDDPTYHWWTKDLPAQGGAVTNVFTDAGLSAAAATSEYAVNVTLYFQLAEAVADEFREGHQAMAQKGSDYNFAYVGKVTDVVKNGASSYIALRLLEAVTSTYPIDSTDFLDVIGNMNPEGATMPNAIAYDPVEFFNYTQIFRTPLSITRTARKTRLRTGDGYQEAKREALELHAIEMEKAFMFSVRSTGTGSNGKPERSTWGLRDFILTNATSNVSNYQTSPGFGGVSWTAAAGGIKWLNEKLEIIFRHGSNEKLGLIGNQGLLGLNRLAQADASINITPLTVSYGIRVLQWITPFGTLFLKTHPLMSHRQALRRDCMIIEPDKLKYRYIDDTFFVSDPQDRKNRNNSRDGTEEEFITEAGMELHHPKAFGYLSGLGLDGTTSA
ncbi:hypothetical protein LCGC14_0939190 [marine sediment metagenome]|uniref:Uncharacterized protein n=1 Tax=marine sediment metagenome TaxID=412755 RepID=A0A0F9NKL4_9ZZZZ